MSQPCCAPLLVLFDVEMFGVSDAADALAALVCARGIARGAISNRSDIAVRLDAVGAAQWFDFWLAGADGDWPLASASALAGVEPQRALVVSHDAAALAAAEESGMRACDADVDVLERQLT